MTALRYCVNVSMLFGELPFLDRFAAVRAAGFDAVEFWWPRGEDLDAVAAAISAAELDVALVNLDGGDLDAGERGLLSDPARLDAWRSDIPEALAFAERVGCRRMNALVGLAVPGLARAEQLGLARASVASAADQAAERGIEILIEALNPVDNGPYLLTTTAETAAFVRSVGRPNVRLQYDAFHMQRTEGDLTATMAAHLDLIGHVQIADAPGRGEPGTGEISYTYVLGRLAALGYAGHVGLEFRPSTGDTTAALGWLPRARRGYRDRGALSTAHRSDRRTSP